MDLIHSISQTIILMFMARANGTVLNEEEYLYYMACLDVKTKFLKLESLKLDEVLREQENARRRDEENDERRDSKDSKNKESDEDKVS